MYQFSNSVIGYRAIHLWVERKLGKPKLCSECSFTSDNGRQFHWANLSGEYKRNLSDWKRLCVSCHRKMDAALKCRHGHERTVNNTKIELNGKRRCITCRHINRKELRIKRRLNYA